MMQNFILRKIYASGLFFFYSLLILFGSHRAFSQTDAVLVKAEFGPKVGPNASIWRGERPYPGMKKPVIGFSLGGFMSLRFAKSRYFQMEINALYSQRGNRCDFTNVSSGLSEEKKITVHYGEVPILFKFMLNPGGTARPYIYFGPTYSGVFRAKFKSARDVEADLVSEDVNQNDLGASLGAGITWFYLDRWYFFDVRYYHGFINTSAYFTKNFDVFDPNWTNNEITSRDLNNGTIGDYFNSTFSLGFAVSLNRQSSFNMR